MIKCRSYQSAAAVAVYCLTDLFRGGYSYSKVIVFCFNYIGDESGRNERFTAAVNTLKIPVAGNRSNLHLTTGNDDEQLWRPGVFSSFLWRKQGIFERNGTEKKFL